MTNFRASEGFSPLNEFWEWGELTSGSLFFLVDEMDDAGAVLESFADVMENQENDANMLEALRIYSYDV